MRTLRVAVLVQDWYEQMLFAAMGDDGNVSVASSMTDLIVLARHSKIDVALVDPLFVGGAAAVTRPELPVEGVVGELVSYCPVLIYTNTSPGAMRASLPFVRAGALGYVFNGVDDRDPRHLLSLIVQASLTRLGKQVAHRLEVVLEDVPQLLRTQIVSLFDGQHPLASIEEIARVSQMTRRTVDRWLVRSGLAPGRRILSAARVVRAYPSLVSGQRSLIAIAKTIGLHTTRALNNQVAVVTGSTPRRIRRESDPERLVEAIVTRLSARDNGDDHADQQAIG